jgi:hypothetical protein
MHDARLLLLLRFAADVLEHLVHIFQAPACSLRYDEVGEDEGEQAEDCKECVGSETGVLNERRSDETLQNVSPLLLGAHVHK